MPIYAPGIRSKTRGVKNTKRNIIAVLQLTAMVDMFTVLVVFLLQNYISTDQILPVHEQIALPQAKSVKTLKASHVVIISKGELSLNNEKIGNLKTMTLDSQVYRVLKQKMQQLLKHPITDNSNFLLSQFKKIQNKENIQKLRKAFFRVTLQADEEVPFIRIRQVMYSLTEAGVKEINFAVIKPSDF